MRYVLGVDIGGTEIKGAVLDENGRIYEKYKERTCITEGRESIYKVLFSVIEKLLNKGFKIDGIGIGSAGKIDTEKGRVISATDNLKGWSKTDIAKDIMDKFNISVKVENDARAALLGEAWIGAAKGYKDVVMLTLGTGVGGANMIDGRIVHGKNFSSGEWGHTILVPKGRECNCGQKGCVEQYVSGSALVKEAKEKGLNIKNGQELMELYLKKDKKAIDVVCEYLNYLSIVVGNIHVGINPEVIIIGGGVINSKDIWWEDFKKLLIEYDDINIIPAQLGNDAGFIGAAKNILNYL